MGDGGLLAEYERHLEAASLAVVTVDTAQRIVAFSPVAERMFGWTADEVLGRTLDVLVPPRFRETHGRRGDAFATESRETGPMGRPFATGLRRNGEEFPVEATRVRSTVDGARRDSVLLRDVTERVCLEQELRLSRERVAAIIESASDGIAIADMATGRYQQVNASLCAMVRRSPEQMFEMSVSELVVPEEVDLLAASRERMLAGGVELGEWRIRRGDGTVGVIEVSARILADGRWLGIARDVSARRQADEERERLYAAIDAERRWLNTVIDTVPTGVLMFDAAGSLRSNRRMEELFGKALMPEGGVAQYADRLLHRDGTPLDADEPLLIGIRGEPSAAGEYLIRRDGTLVPVLGSTAPIHDPDGRLIGAVAVFQDVSERMRREEAIRTNERLLEGIFELLPVGLWIADKSGRIVRGNPAGLAIWGGARYVPAEEFGQYRGWWLDTGERISPEDWALHRALTRGETSIGELIRIQCFDDTFKTIRNSAMPLRDEQGKFAGAVVVNEDITDLRATEEALERAVSARDKVLAVVSHDLRNPVSAISMGAQLLGRQAEQRSDLAWLREPIDRIARAAQVLRRLIDDLLDISCIEEGKLSIRAAALAPCELAPEIVALHVEAAHHSEVELVTELSAELPDIVVDRDRILQVLSNLVGNALKFTPAGGRVVVRAARRGEELVFTVSDTGPGISAAQQARLFDRFWQADPNDLRGRGLGLAIARGIVEAHGGRIWVESVVGRGSSFSFSVPLAG